MKAVSATVGVEESAVRALEAGVDALCVGHDLGEDDVVRDVRRRSSRAFPRSGCARRPAGSRGSRRGLARRAACPTAPVGADAARRALDRSGDTTLPDAPAHRRAASGCEHRRRRGRALARAPRSCARASPFRAADVYVVRDAHRHPWMQAAADVDGAVVVETGLPLWRPSRARGYVVDATAAAARRTTPSATCSRRRARVSSHLEPELAEQPQALARLIERQRANAEEIASLFRRAGRAVHPDRVARQLVERCALRAVRARSRAPRAGRVRDAVALHALRAAAAARRRARARHLAVGRVARREGGDRGGTPAGPADGRDHERPASPLARPATRCCRSRRAPSRRSPRRRPTSTRSARSRCSSRRRPARRLGELERDPGAARAPARAVARRRREALDAARRRHRRRARRQLRHRVRDRAEDPRAFGAALRGVLRRRPDARAGRGDRRRAGRCSRSRRPGRRARRWTRRSRASRAAARG